TGRPTGRTLRPQATSLCRRRRSRSASRHSQGRSGRPRAPGLRAHTRTSPTSTRSTRAATSPLGKSLSSSRARCGRPSSRCASRSREETKGAVQQQPPGINRIDLQQHDISAPGREVIQNVVTISTEAPPIRHKHPGGEEIIYVLEGSLEYTVEGQEPTTVNAGEVFFVPADTVHAVRNVGTPDAS